MKNNWKITSLYYGKIHVPRSAMTAGLDPDIWMWIPYTGFLLQNGEETILVDTGINDANIKDGRAWGGYEAVGGVQYVIDALAKEGLKPEDIDTVMYTHLHNDHTGALLQFPNARTIFQRAEWENLFNQLPTQKVRADFDPRTPGEIVQLKNVNMIDGDVKMANGLEIYKLGAHTSGSMAIVVPTAEGRYVITGDMPHLYANLFPKSDTWETLEGETIKVSPAPDVFNPFMFNSVIYDHFTCYDSYNKLLMLAEKPEPKWFLTGHDAWVINKHKFG